MTDTTYDNSTELDPRIAARLKRDAKGLVAAVIQQYDTREVLMVGYMNDEALRRTLTTGRVTFWSRSRQEYWRKGDTSGHVQYVKGVSLDCDGDALLVEVVPSRCRLPHRQAQLLPRRRPPARGRRPSPGRAVERAFLTEGSRATAYYETRHRVVSKGANMSECSVKHLKWGAPGPVANSSTNWPTPDTV